MRTSPSVKTGLFSADDELESDILVIGANEVMALYSLIQLWPYMVMALYSLIQLCPYTVMALYSLIQLLPYIVMAI